MNWTRNEDWLDYNKVVEIKKLISTAQSKCEGLRRKDEFLNETFEFLIRSLQCKVNYLEYTMTLQRHKKELINNENEEG